MCHILFSSLYFRWRCELLLVESLSFKYTAEGKRHADSSWEFLKIENVQIKTAQDNSYGWKIAWNY